MTKVWRTGDELSFREAKNEPARVMELELLHKFRIRARISGYSGFEDRQNNERRMFLAQTGLVRSRSRFQTSAKESRFHDEACHAYSSRHHNHITSQHRKIIPKQFYMQHFSREVLYAASQALRQPPTSGASRMKLVVCTSQRYRDPSISQDRKIIPQQFHKTLL